MVALVLHVPSAVVLAPVPMHGRPVKLPGMAGNWIATILFHSIPPSGFLKRKKFANSGPTFSDPLIYKQDLSRHDSKSLFLLQMTSRDFGKNGHRYAFETAIPAYFSISTPKLTDVANYEC